MESICRFVPEKQNKIHIQPVHFVYETELAKLTQPFIRPIPYLNLVVCGTGILTDGIGSYKLEKGSLFFMFPANIYELKATEDFEFFYISFTGDGIEQMLSSFGIGEGRPVYRGFSLLIPFWQEAITRITPKTANVLTESVLLYTLSFIQGKAQRSPSRASEQVSEYVDVHFNEPDISMRKVAQRFSYSEKYLSATFRKNTGVRFTEYLNRKRISYARQIMRLDEFSVAEVSAMCGYNDPLYFSRMFKSITGLSPKEYRENLFFVTQKQI